MEHISDVRAECMTNLTRGVSYPLASYPPVLALTLLRRAPDGLEILTGVRSRATNLTHQDVVSVPTKRVGDPDCPALWLDARELGTGAQDVRADLFLCPDQEAARMRLQFWVEYLLMLKLGVSDAMERGELKMDLADLGVWQGLSLIDYDQGCDVTEPLTMFNALAYLEHGSGLFPAQTVSYDPLAWVRIEDFVRAVQNKDIFALGLDVDPLAGIEMCIRGLCVETTMLMLEKAGILSDGDGTRLAIGLSPASTPPAAALRKAV